MKLSQILTAYACDTAQTEVTEANAKKYLKQHDIVDADVQKISEQLIRKEIRERKIRSLVIDFHVTGMERVINPMEGKESPGTFEELYARAYNYIQELL